MRKNFRTYQIAVEFYQQAKELTLPRHLHEQCQRAASSIVLNLAEGAGRTSGADQARFYSIALGSTRECMAILDLTTNPNSIMLDNLDKLAAHIFKLIKYCKGG